LPVCPQFFGDALKPLATLALASAALFILGAPTAFSNDSDWSQRQKCWDGNPPADANLPCFAADVQRIVNTYAGSAVQDGSAVGVGVGVAIGDAPARFFSYGYADWGSRQTFSPDTIFEIGSVTKVFTTNLLGQSDGSWPT
jgi:CubicO group peptidase (beta-lactamase class C family)